MMISVQDVVMNSILQDEVKSSILQDEVKNFFKTEAKNPLQEVKYSLQNKVKNSLPQDEPSIDAAPSQMSIVLIQRTRSTQNQPERKTTYQHLHQAVRKKAPTPHRYAPPPNW